jgi:tetratricopeptide (TPR) repeat protein
MGAKILSEAQRGAMALLARARSQPSNPLFWKDAAAALAQTGLTQEAEQAFDQYFARAPAHKLVLDGVRLQQAGDLENAASSFRRAIAIEPDNVDALRMLGVVSAALGNAAESLRSARQAVRFAPQSHEAWNNMGSVLSEFEFHEEALEAFRHAANLSPECSATQTNLANALTMNGDIKGAERAFKKALALTPEDATSLLGLGHVYKTLGKENEAVSAYRAAIKSRPMAGEPWWSLANLKTFRFTAEEIAALERLLCADTLSNSARVNINYALGKAKEDGKDFRNAFKHYSEGARLHRARIKYDPAQTDDLVTRLCKTFTKDFMNTRLGVGQPDPAPIFIVGLPRSGSTLVEQILASHSQVDGTAELPALPRTIQEMQRHFSPGIAYPEAIRDLAINTFAAFGDDYLRRAARYRGNRSYFVDKNPNNFLSVGVIALILPNAKIIDARRHPLDACFGSFKQHFARGQTFTYDLSELGRFYLQYDHLMRWWDEVSPGRILRVDYENVVLDQENQTRRLLDFCGLSFEEQCLRFHETERAVNTASAAQVRRPLYTSSLGAWRRYTDDLADLATQLAPVIDALPQHIRDAGQDRPLQ